MNTMNTRKIKKFGVTFEEISKEEVKDLKTCGEAIVLYKNEGRYYCTKEHVELKEVQHFCTKGGSCCARFRALPDDVGCALVRDKIPTLEKYSFITEAVENVKEDRVVVCNCKNYKNSTSTRKYSEKERMKSLRTLKGLWEIYKEEL